MLACPECERPFAEGRCPCRRDWTETGGVPDLYVPAPDRGESPEFTSRIRGYYEDRAPSGELAAAAADPLLAALDAHLAPDAKIVDLGCGAGAAAALLGARGREVVGVDLSMAALLRAEAHRRRVNLPSVSFVRANLFRPPVAPGSADTVLFLGSLEHCGSPEAAVVAGVRLLRLGGLMVVRVATPWTAETPPEQGPPHDGRYTPEEARSWLVSAGLRPLSREDQRAYAAVLSPWAGGWAAAAVRTLRWSWFGGGPARAVVAARR